MADAAAPAPPPTVKVAAGLLVAHALLVLAGTITLAANLGWGLPRFWIRAAARLAASLVVAWGLLRVERWAWVLGLVLATAWLALGAVTTLVVERHDLFWPQPSRWQLSLAASLLCLGGVVALLLTPSARAAFRRRG